MQFNQFQNGIGRSKADQNGFDSIVNGDVHNELGYLQCQTALVADSSSNVPTEPCVQATSPAGTEYFFSTSSTKIWKRSTAGVYSSITANANSGGHRGASYYNGYIYFWTAAKLGRFVVETEASRNNSFGTFSNGNAYGSCEENLTLFINDGKYVASVNSSGTFQANALDVPAQYVGSCIIPDGFTNILIGTIISTSVEHCRAFLWDTYSDSFTLSDEVPEIGINCFINCDEMILAQCGTQGHLYQWTGQAFAVFENELRGETTASGHQMSTVYKGRPLIAVGTKIYSIYRKNASVPRVLVREYTATGNITSLGVSAATLIVSHASGVNKTGTNKATATITTPEIKGQANIVNVDYVSLPSGTSIGIETKVDGGNWTTQTPITDTIRKHVYFDGGLGTVNFLQARITLTPSSSSTPVISNINII